MTKLVAIEMPGGDDFVTTLRQIWEDGDAALPIDLRLPAPERARLLEAMAPHAIIDPSGRTELGNSGAELLTGDALVIPTSGTTGAPKGVIHTHDSIAASAVATSNALDVDPSTDRWIGCLPLAHVGGLSVVTRSIHTGTALEVHDGFDPARVLDALERGATLISVVTRTLHQIPIDRFRRVLIGGAAPPPDRADNVIATYGMTETGSGIVYERRPIDGAELRVDDDGELWVRGPMLFRAYRTANHEGGNGGGDAAGTDPKTGDGWFATGDLGAIDDDGVLSVFGRRGDVVVTGGEKVWPAKVEPVLSTHPGVSEAAITGRPHPEWGHEVVVHVVPVDPANPPTLESIRDHVKAELPSWYAPRVLVLRDELPKTSLGKVRRDQLS